MFNAEQRQAIAGFTPILQIIILALFAGVLSYVGFILFADPQQAADRPILAPLGAVFAVILVVLSVVVPRMIGAQHRRAAVEGRSSISPAAPAVWQSLGDGVSLLSGFQVQRIIGAAMLEGAAFFNAVAYQLERQRYSLAIVAALMACLLTLVPLRARVEEWLAQEMRAVKELRDLQR
jgi:hypothetical protein